MSYPSFASFFIQQLIYSSKYSRIFIFYFGLEGNAYLFCCSNCLGDLSVGSGLLTSTLCGILFCFVLFCF